MFYKKNWKRPAFASIIMLAILAAFSLAFQGSRTEPTPLRFTEFLHMLETGYVTDVVLSESAQIRFSLSGRDGVFTTANPRSPGFKEELLILGVDVHEASGADFGTVLMILLFAGGAVFVTRLLGRNSPSREAAFSPDDSSKPASGACLFADVAGNQEAKESMQDIVDFIKNPCKYSRFGARMPRGVIFYGAPGTGKTLLARAVAGESGVPFFSVSGSDFVQMYVGVGAKRVRELFKKARAHGQAVIFIDEIDALGKKRQAAPTGGSDERDQTLNALLTEMSGFSSTEGIIVIAATNRLDALDEALLRPGRFDRHVEIGLPDIAARRSILEHHAANKPLHPLADIEALVRKTASFSGAMLENLLNEAAILAAKAGADEVTNANMDEAFLGIVAGAAKKDTSFLSHEERRITAYHEAGHALISRLVSPDTLVSKVSIIPSTRGTGGFCMSIMPEKMYYTKQNLEARVKVLLAGRAAEELILGKENITTAAGNDIERATTLCKDYIGKYGMGKSLLNLEVMGNADKLAQECSKLLGCLYNEALDEISNNLAKLHEIAKELIENETLDETDILRITG